MPEWAIIGTLQRISPKIEEAEREREMKEVVGVDVVRLMTKKEKYGAICRAGRPSVLFVPCQFCAVHRDRWSWLCLQRNGLSGVSELLGCFHEDSALQKTSIYCLCKCGIIRATTNSFILCSCPILFVLVWYETLLTDQTRFNGECFLVPSSSRPSLTSGPRILLRLGR